MNKVMSPEEFKKRMQEIKIKEEAGSYFFDREQMHIYMDELMCEVLRDLGYTEGVEIFEHTSKWYA